VQHGVAIGGLGIGLAAGLLGGCPSLLPYVCTDDVDCDRGAALGQCLDDGACAYPDEACSSGLVRSPNAAERPGACVPVDAAESSSTTDTASSSATTPLPTTSTDTGPQPSCGAQVRLEVATEFLSTTEVLADYPLLLVVDDAAIVLALAEAGGAPIVTTDDGTLLAVDVERLDPDEGVLVAWVRLPAYALGVKLPLLLRFGTELAPGDSTATWADHYAGVWHLDETPSGVDGDELRNSASPAEPGVSVGDMAAQQSVAGAFGRGLQLDGLDDTIEIRAAFVGTLESYTVSMWMRYDDTDGDRGHYFYRLNGNTLYPRCWRFGEVPDGSDGVFCQYEMVDGDPVAFPAGVSQAVGQLVQLVVIRDAAASTHRIYVDGELIVEQMDPRGAVLESGDEAMLLGRGEDELSLDGMIDEVCVSTAPIPATWIRADFRTQVDPTAAVAIISGVEPIPAGDCAG